MIHVVVMEDDAVNAMLFRSILERRGKFRVTLTEDVAQLLHLAQSGDASLVVMDVLLSHAVHEGSRVNGVDLARLLKGDPATRGVPVILATALAMRGDAERLMRESLADAYVSKPIVNQQAFVDQVRTLVEARRAA